MQLSEARFDPRHQRFDVVRRRHVCTHVDDLGAGSAQRPNPLLHLRGRLRASGQHDARAEAASEMPREQQTQSSGAAGDQEHAAVADRGRRRRRERGRFEPPNAADPRRVAHVVALVGRELGGDDRR